VNEYSDLDRGHGVAFQQAGWQRLGSPRLSGFAKVSFDRA
jgi:hypothetical protein